MCVGARGGSAVACHDLTYTTDYRCVVVSPSTHCLLLQRCFSALCLAHVFTLGVIQMLRVNLKTFFVYNYPYINVLLLQNNV